MKTNLIEGPITCNFMVTDNFLEFWKDTKGDEKYWSDTELFLNLNHAISIVGWANKKDFSYWIV